MVRGCRWAVSAVAAVLGAACAARVAAGGMLLPVAPARPAWRTGGAPRRGGGRGSDAPSWRPPSAAADALLHPTARLSLAKLTKVVPPIERPATYYFLEVDVVHPPGGAISDEFDALLRRLTDEWFKERGIDVQSMFLVHVKAIASVEPRRRLTYYLSMSSGNPRISAEFSDYCGFLKKPGQLPGLVKDLRKDEDVGKLVEVSMVSAMSHEPRLENGGTFDAQTGELIVPKSKNGPSDALLRPAARLTKAKLTKVVPPIERPAIYYFFEIDIVHPPGGTISDKFDALLKRLTNKWFKEHGVKVQSMFLEHVKVTSSVAPRRSLIYYLSMASGDPHITVEFSEYCGFRKKPGELPGLVKELRKYNEVGKQIEVSMVSAMSHESRLQNGGTFDAQSGELIVPKNKKGLSASTLIIIIVSCVVGTVAVVGAGLMFYFRARAESAERYFPWMADRLRRSSAASSYRDQDSFVGDEGDYAARHGAPSFSLSPPERPARGGATEWNDEAEGSEDEDAREDSQYGEEELGQSASGRESRETSSSFSDVMPGVLPDLPPPGN